MGCGSSNYVEDDSKEYGPDGLQLYEWWAAGDMVPGNLTRSGEKVPIIGPFENAATPRTNVTEKVKFDIKEIDKDSKGGAFSHALWKWEEPIYARAFFSHSLPCYSVGWARLELSKERPHHNTRKIKEKEEKLLQQGKVPDYSKRRKYFLYPESIKDIGIFLWLNGKSQETNAAVSGDPWDCEPIAGAFFTFTPDRGAVYGNDRTALQDSLSIPFRPCPSDSSTYEDVRWSRLHLELLKLLQNAGDGTHSVRIETRYRYGNWKFVAWNDDMKDGKATGYRYSDEDRETEEAVSASVAQGEMKVKLTKEEVKMKLPLEIEKISAITKRAAERLKDS